MKSPRSHSTAARASKAAFLPPGLRRCLPAWPALYLLLVLLPARGQTRRGLCRARQLLTSVVRVCDNGGRGVEQPSPYETHGVADVCRLGDVNVRPYGEETR